jgi:2',3'-cyclic-nucleotide 2'-phosphodiesterase
MRILFFGDIIGRSGREALSTHLPRLKEKLSPDFIIVNGENAAHGFGITDKIARDLFALGVDCITTGNHAWDQRDLIGTIDRTPALLRPANFPDGTPGRGHVVLSNPMGQKLLVCNLMGRLFMDPLDDPFAAANRLLAQYPLGGAVQGAVFDFHAETTSEKMAFGHFLDGRASLVVGTHTHIPTADAQILPGGTAYQTDAGMCGDYDSVIGMQKAAPIARFVRKMPTDKLTPADGVGTLCGVFVETAPTGLATRIDPIRLGGRLKESFPSS